MSSDRPYCIRDYLVDDHLGGPAGLAAARAALAGRGVSGLILDFVPNHVAPDHPGSRDRPELFVTGTAATTWTLTRRRSSQVGGRVVANGRDPYFPAWPDVVQLNVFHPAAPGGRDRHPACDRRPVRRGALRHGDADDERRVRPHLG